ncbi:MAG TPA: toll/interleukin-1 receptor domain-containing protein [Leptolyngbyaceae cyanobacterium M65_K2018_010]|nr:toll/interleukin-1 receptor domain-containing protein [Leptolyngbyaceae cyanobacterium M65_K2018_010]
MTADAITVFFSYSHKDEALRDELAKHLKILEKQGVIASWHDRRILPGDEWDHEIKDSLKSAHIILLLISSDFIASNYCWDIEITHAMERHKAGEARVIPIILRPCLWQPAPVGTMKLGQLQALPKNATPITEWPNQDAAYTNVAEELYKTVQEIQQEQVEIIKPEVVKPPLPEPKPPEVNYKELSECNPSKILFIKNIRDPGGGWAYTLDRI